MKIIHISDIHCNDDAIKRLYEKERDYDIMISTGDFECLQTAELFSELFRGAISVSGNLDSVPIMKLLIKRGILIDGKIIERKGLVIAGIGGIDTRTNIMAIENLLKTTKKIDILISHNPPYGILDMTSIGIRAGLSELVRINKAFTPKLHLFGHIHESKGHIYKDKTHYVNPGPLMEGLYATIVLEDDVKITMKSL
ncbi:MAG: metallophosphoesterase family protein [Caldisphaeraceae archaeon]|nr:metallophosphoesterase family protein [Caldisphaeraceae archaeon]